MKWQVVDFEDLLQSMIEKLFYELSQCLINVLQNNWQSSHTYYEIIHLNQIAFENFVSMQWMRDFIITGESVS